VAFNTIYHQAAGQAVWQEVKDTTCFYCKLPSVAVQGQYDKGGGYWFKCAEHLASMDLGVNYLMIQPKVLTVEVIVK
jgi:hypothetical protein